VDFTVKETQKVYHGTRIVVYRDFVQQPDGSEVTREVVELNNAAAVVALTAGGEVVLIRQFRYPAKGELIEIPAGILDENEEPLNCARRELEEETGYTAQSLSHLGRIHVSPGICTENIDIFLAEDIRKGEQNLEHGEVIKPMLVKFEDALKMIEAGEIIDAKTICGLLMAKGKINAGR